MCIGVFLICVQERHVISAYLNRILRTVVATDRENKPTGETGTSATLLGDTCGGVVTGVGRGSTRGEVAAAGRLLLSDVGGLLLDANRAAILSNSDPIKSCAGGWYGPGGRMEDGKNGGGGIIRGY